uniref:DUF2177 family protein n=1 Tax=viral metagenome TaxID=1070528 RepID=A0A6C0C530_9ZZZZ
MELKMLILTGIIISIIDILFITYIFSHEYKPLIKSVQKATMEVNYISALMTYLITICGLYYFIIKDRRSILDAVILGMFVYGVFAWTNYSLLKNWSFRVAIIDTVWGGILFGLTTMSLQYIENVFRR